MVLRALIVDDEKPARDELAYLLGAHPDVAVSQAASASQALDAIEADHPDLVLCDIHLPGSDGFEILRRARALPRVPLFVFVTAYDAHAIEAFEQNAVDYLLKPVAPERLAVSLDRVRARLAEGRAGLPDALESLLTGLGRGAGLARVAVEQHGHRHRVHGAALAGAAPHSDYGRRPLRGARAPGCRRVRPFVRVTQRNAPGRATVPARCRLGRAESLAG